MGGQPDGAADDAPPYPYEFDSDAREKARLLASRRLDFILLNPDIVVLPALFILLAAGWAAGVRDAIVGVTPLWSLQVAGLVAIVSTIAWVAVLLPGLILFVMIQRVSRRRLRWTAYLASSGVSHLQSLVYLIILALGFYWLASNLQDWWLAASVIASGGIALIYYLETRPHRSGRGAAGPLRERFSSLALDSGASRPQGIRIATTKESWSPALTIGGPARCVVLSEEMVGKMHPKELDVVMAHEIGHIVNRDLTRRWLFETATIFLSFLLLAVVLQLSTGTWGLGGAADIATFPMLLLFARLRRIAFLPLSNFLSRSLELEADRFSLLLTGDPVAYISAHKRMADQELAELDSDSLTRHFLSTHPSVRERIAVALPRMRATRKGEAEGLREPSPATIEELLKQYRGKRRPPMPPPFRLT